MGVYSAVAEPPDTLSRKAHNLRHSSSFPFFLAVFFHFFVVFMTLNKYILPTLYALKTTLRGLERGVYLYGLVEGTSIENTKTERTCSKTRSNQR